MDAIFFRDGVYVLLKNIPSEREEDIKKDPQLVVIWDYQGETQLFGGRVDLSCNAGYANLTIDGIDICKVNVQKNYGSYSIDRFYTTYGISVETAVSFLNDMYGLGVDTFLDNYKRSLKDLRTDVISLKEKLEAEVAVEPNKKKSSQIECYDDFLHSLVIVLFTLMIHMNAGIDNHVYIDAFNSIANIYLF